MIAKNAKTARVMPLKLGEILALLAITAVMAILGRRLV